MSPAGNVPCKLKHGCDTFSRRVWLPQTAEDEADWSPASIVKAQTGNFHYMWFDMQRSLADWVAAGQAHQAWVTRIMTEAFRREIRMNTFAIHLFIDAFPSGWMKTIMDCERRPKPAFFARPAASTVPAPMAVLGVPGGSAESLARELGCEPCAWQDGEVAAATILVDDLTTALAHEPALRSAVQTGACVIVLGVPVGEHSFLGAAVEAKACGMGPVQFVSRATGHPLVAGFAPDDFKFWYDAAMGYATPLLDVTFVADGWTPILISGNGVWGGGWEPALAAAEKPEGSGCWRLCNVKLSGRIQGNPVAEIFARRLIRL